MTSQVLRGRLCELMVPPPWRVKGTRPGRPLSALPGAVPPVLIFAMDGSCYAAIARGRLSTFLFCGSCSSYGAVRPSMDAAPSIHIGGVQIPAARNRRAQIGLGDCKVIGHARTFAVKVAAPNKLPRICLLAHGAHGQMGIRPHKKIDNTRMGTTLAGNHARPPWSFVTAPLPATASYPLPRRYAIKTRPD